MAHPLSQQLPWGSPPPELRTGDVPAGVDGLQALALQVCANMKAAAPLHRRRRRRHGRTHPAPSSTPQGRWREVVQRARAATATNTATALRVGTWSILALTKLGMVDDAAAEMAKLGSLEDPAFLGSRAQVGCDHGGLAAGHGMS